MFRPLSLANFTREFFDSEVETTIELTAAYGQHTRKVQDAIKDTYYRLSDADDNLAWANATVQVKKGQKLTKIGDNFSKTSTYYFGIGK